MSSEACAAKSTFCPNEWCRGVNRRRTKFFKTPKTGGERTLQMNRERRIAAIRQRRDLSLEVVNMLVWTAYFLVTFVYLSVNDMEGNNILKEALIVYASYAISAALYIWEIVNMTVGSAMKSLRSYIALLFTLIIAFPVRVLLHGICGYCEFAKRECIRINHLEMTRRKERP